MAIEQVKRAGSARKAALLPSAKQVNAAEERGAQASQAQAFVKAAQRFLGQDYKWGAGHNPNYGQKPSNPSVQPVDCSGLVGQAAAMVGANLDGVAKDQSEMGMKVPLTQLKAGDLVFRSRGEGGMHVGIYDGKGGVIQAPQTGKQVETVPFDPSKWSQAVRPWLGGQATQEHEPVQQSSKSAKDASRVVRPNNPVPEPFDFN